MYEISNEVIFCDRVGYVRASEDFERVLQTERCLRCCFRQFFSSKHKNSFLIYLFALFGS